MGVIRHICSGLLVLILCHIFIDVSTEPQRATRNLSLYSPPHCSKPCTNGKCIGSEICSCKAGYIPSRRDKFDCLPLCRGGCPRGANCTAPGTCSCGSDYTLESKKCEPTCSNSTNGICPKQRGQCACSKGWRKIHSTGVCQACVARCDRPCGNSTCISPNVCACLPGYDFRPNLLKNIGGSLCVPQCQNCEGSCIAPKKCVCNKLYEAKNVSASGGDCDCFYNCSGSQRICEKTICVIANSNSNKYFWIYLLVPIIIIAIAMMIIALVCLRKRRAFNYNVNDKKTASSPPDCVLMSQITNTSRS